GGVVEVPLWRGEPPDELVELTPILVVASPTAFGGEVILIPPRQFRLWWQWRPVGGLAADEVPTHCDERFAAVGPEGRQDVGRARAPIKPGDHRIVDAQRVQQRERIQRQRRLLPVAGCLI